MRNQGRSVMPVSRPQADVPVSERGTVRGRAYLLFGEFANRVSMLVGSPWAFLLALVSIVLWGVTGPVFGYSDSWQLIINTSTTIVTFLMVFLIQHTQNKDARAIQLKLNELIAAVKGASGRLINIEKMSDEELDRLQGQFQALADQMRAHGEIIASHTIEEEREDTPGGEAGAEIPGASAAGGGPRARPPV